MMPIERVARSYKIWKARKEGVPAKALAIEWSLSRSRIYQIVNQVERAMLSRPESNVFKKYEQASAALQAAHKIMFC